MAATATLSHTATTRAFPLKYFVLAFAFTGFFWTLAALGARHVIPAFPGLTVIGTLGPLVAAVLITAQESGRAGLRSLLGRVVRWRVAPIWYGVASLGPARAHAGRHSTARGRGRAEAKHRSADRSAAHSAGDGCLHADLRRAG